MWITAAHTNSAFSYSLTTRLSTWIIWKIRRVNREFYLSVSLSIIYLYTMEMVKMTFEIVYYEYCPAVDISPSVVYHITNTWRYFTYIFIP